MADIQTEAIALLTEDQSEASSQLKITENSEKIQKF